MKKITKILTTMFAFVLVITGAICLTACTNNKDNDKNLCIVSYDFNFNYLDYSILKSCLKNGLSFKVAGFEEQSNIVEPENISIVYTRQIELGRGFILYEFQDTVLNSYLEGWYTSSGVRVDEINSTVKNDITLYAKWKEDLYKLTSAHGINFEYTFDEYNLTASFKNATANNISNGVGVITLPEIVFNGGKFYVVNDIDNNSSREHMVYYVPKTYTGRINYPIVFPNKDTLCGYDITYLGNFISQQIGGVICIYEANYTTNTLRLMHIDKVSAINNNNYLKIGEDIKLCRDGDVPRTLKITGFYGIFPGDTCPYTKYILSKDLTDRFPIFYNVLENNNNKRIQVFYEFTKGEVEQMGYNVWLANGYNSTESIKNVTEVCYYYSETQPTKDGYNYWHYVKGDVVIWQ